MMERSRRALVATASVLVMATVSAQEPERQSDGLGAALTSGEATLAVRYRYERVDQDNIAEKADASTARLRLNYKTGQWNGWSAFGEFDHIFHVLLRDFNSGAGTTPGRGQYPVVADPSGSDLNQLYVDYRSSDEWLFRIGRQRILLDDQRFVGGVGWRQNEQTYDALTASTGAIANIDLSYSYVNYIRRIFGDTVPAGKEKVDAHLLNLKIPINDSWSATPYLYYLDYDDPSSAANSTATVGIRFAGGLQTGDNKISLLGEFATQSDAANNPVSYDTEYYHVDALWAMPGGLALGIGLESLGGSSQAGQAFRTPLATLHKFQGWADRFLATPAAGINDIYVTAKYKIDDWSLVGVYHDFSAESGGGDYGQEWDISVGRGFAKHYGVLFKAAFFSGDTAAFPDTSKVWIQLVANY